jgi:hypothetical protein
MRLGLRGPQAGLLGVGAKGAVDRQVEAGLVARRGGHAVEGGGDVRPHRLSLPIGERTVVSAALAVGGDAGPVV